MMEGYNPKVEQAVLREVFNFVTELSPRETFLLGDFTRELTLINGVTIHVELTIDSNDIEAHKHSETELQTEIRALLNTGDPFTISEKSTVNDEVYHLKFTVLRH